MPRGCDYAVHVQLEGRYFIAEFDADGNALRIKERKQKQLPTIGVYDASWWVASSHALGTKNTLPKRIIAAAHVKTIAEHESANATP